VSLIAYVDFINNMGPTDIKKISVCFEKEKPGILKS